MSVSTCNYYLKAREFITVEVVTYVVISNNVGTSLLATVTVTL